MSAKALLKAKARVAVVAPAPALSLVKRADVKPARVEPKPAPKSETPPPAPPAKKAPPAPTVKLTASRQLRALQAEIVAVCSGIGMPVRPLKIGIAADLETRVAGMSKKRRRLFLKLYTHTKEYLDACIEGAARVDLDSNPAGVVTAEEALYAAERRQRMHKPAATQVAK